MIKYSHGYTVNGVLGSVGYSDEAQPASKAESSTLAKVISLVDVAFERFWNRIDEEWLKEAGYAF